MPAIAKFLVLLFLLAALLYVSLRRGDGTNAKSWAIVAISIFLTLNISDVLILPLVLQTMNPSESVVSYGIYSFVASMLSIIGHSFLIAAVFAGRKSKAADIYRNLGGAGVSDDNPYAASSK